MDIENPVTCKHGELIVNCSACVEIESLKAENARLHQLAEITNDTMRRMVEGANAQPPIAHLVHFKDEFSERFEVGMDIRILDNRDGKSLKELKSETPLLVISSPGAYVDLSGCAIEGFLVVVVKTNMGFYPAIAVGEFPSIFIPNKNSMSNITLNISHGRIGTSVLNNPTPILAQQSPAVVVPDYKEELFQLRQQAENWSTKLGFITSAINSRKISLSDKEREFPHLLIERLHTDSELLKQRSESPRITEQDAREIILHFCSYYNFGIGISSVEKWIARKGRALLNKLNGDKNGQ